MMHTGPIPVIPLPGPVDVKDQPTPETKQEPELVQIEPTQETHLLHDLTLVDRLFITRRLQVKNAIFFRGNRNRFFVRTPDQSLIYSIEEELRWWAGYFCYGLRPLHLRVSNSQGTEIMRIHRPYKCTNRFLPCQLQRLQVFCPPGTLIGTIKQHWTTLRPLYKVKNERGDVVFWVRGPLLTLTLFRDVQFQIMRADGTPAGATSKRWQGLVHELFLAHTYDKFGVSFEHDLGLEEKALLMAATILMNYMYYDI